jgi:nucleoside-diphosphate-sugar epimerase
MTTHKPRPTLHKGSSQLTTEFCITGIRGFVGTSLQRLLESGGILYSELPLDRRGVVLDRQPNAVIHLAARRSLPSGQISDAGVYSTNMAATRSALEVARRFRSSFLYVSSYLYDVDTEEPVDESSPVCARNSYQQSKLDGEELVRQFWLREGLPTTIIRPFNVYGPGQSEEFIIGKICRALVGKRRIALRELTSKRDFIFVDDVGRLIISATLMNKGFEVLNAGSGTLTSLVDLVGVIRNVSGENFDVEVASSEEPQEPVAPANLSHVKRVVGWSPRVSLAEGIAETIRHLRQS